MISTETISVSNESSAECVVFLVDRFGAPDQPPCIVIPSSSWASVFPQFLPGTRLGPGASLGLSYSSRERDVTHVVVEDASGRLFMQEARSRTVVNFATPAPPEMDRLVAERPLVWRYQVALVCIVASWAMIVLWIVRSLAHLWSAIRAARPDN